MDYVHEREQLPQIYGAARDSQISKQYVKEYYANYGTLDWKFKNKEESKDYCFGLLRSNATWRTNFILFGNDMGESGIPNDNFPWSNDERETLFWNDGQIVSYILPKADLQHGVMLDRQIVWDALQAMYERNRAMIKWKINRAVIKSRIREI